MERPRPHPRDDNGSATVRVTGRATQQPAVVAAYRAGTTATALRQACGVSSEQLARWCKGATGTAGSGKGYQKAAPARAFPVADSSERSATEGEQMGRRPELELRIGSWAVRVWQLGLGGDR
jgi:hypothetical protein